VGVLKRVAEQLTGDPLDQDGRVVGESVVVRDVDLNHRSVGAGRAAELIRQLPHGDLRLSRRRRGRYKLVEQRPQLPDVVGDEPLCSADEIPGRVRPGAETLGTDGLQQQARAGEAGDDVVVQALGEVAACQLGGGQTVSAHGSLLHAVPLHAAGERDRQGDRRERDEQQPRQEEREQVRYGAACGLGGRHWDVDLEPGVVVVRVTQGDVDLEPLPRQAPLVRVLGIVGDRLHHDLATVELCREFRSQGSRVSFDPLLVGEHDAGHPRLDGEDLDPVDHPGPEERRQVRLDLVPVGAGYLPEPPLRHGHHDRGGDLPRDILRRPPGVVLGIPPHPDGGQSRQHDGDQGSQQNVPAEGAAEQRTRDRDGHQYRAPRVMRPSRSAETTASSWLCTPSFAITDLMWSRAVYREMPSAAATRAASRP
jgi:hypothetical protein